MRGAGLDKAGLGRLIGTFTAMRPRLVALAHARLGSRALAEDLVQDTLIAVVEQHARRRGEASLSTWATAILRNKVADWYRAPARRRMATKAFACPASMARSAHVWSSANATSGKGSCSHTERRMHELLLEKKCSHWR